MIGNAFKTNDGSDEPADPGSVGVEMRIFMKFLDVENPDEILQPDLCARRCILLGHGPTRKAVVARLRQSLAVLLPCFYKVCCRRGEKVLKWLIWLDRWKGRCGSRGCSSGVDEHDGDYFNPMERKKRLLLSKVYGFVPMSSEMSPLPTPHGEP